MNIVFWILLLAAVVFMYFLLALLFRPIGKFFMRLYKDVENEIKKEDNKEKEKE